LFGNSKYFSTLQNPLLANESSTEDCDDASIEKASFITTGVTPTLALGKSLFHYEMSTSLFIRTNRSHCLNQEPVLHHQNAAQDPPQQNLNLNSC